MTATTSGQAVPVKETVTLPPTMAALQKWRNADHEDHLTLNRDDVIMLIEEETSSLLQVRADAAAAQSLMLERCAEVVPQGWCEPETANTIMDVELGMAIQAVIRRLAPIDGLALVRELRAERDEAYVRGMAAGQQALAQIKGPLQVIDSPELHTLRAERDRLAAANAVLEAKVAGLVRALEPSAETKAAYMGEFYMGVTMSHPRLGEETLKVQIPWTTIKEVMAAIRALAALASHENGERK